MTGYDSSRVAPFGHLRIKACLAAPRSISLPTASFIASWRQGIHQMPLNAFNSFLSHPIQLSKNLPKLACFGHRPNTTLVVEVNGFEPMASCVQGRRSPS